LPLYLKNLRQDTQVPQFKKFKKVLDSARIQGLSEKDYMEYNKYKSFVSNGSFDTDEIIEYGNINTNNIYAVCEDTEEYNSKPLISLTFTLDDEKKIIQRGKDLVVSGETITNENIPYDIESYITEYDSDKIDSEYLDSKFEKYLKNLMQEFVSEEELDESLSELNNAFAYLSVEQQKYANIFIHDIASKNVEIISGKSFIEYVTEYQNKAKNDQITKISGELGLNENLLRTMIGLNLKELNINEFGRLDMLKKSVNMEAAKVYFEKVEKKSLPYPLINIKLDKLLRNFIIKDEI
jgi:type I restriction enzyme R subunit